MGRGPGAAGLEEVRPGVHAWVQPDGSWWVNNAGAVTGGDGVLVVDTCATAQRTRRFLDAVDAAAGGVPVRLAVNTHQHGDHTYGNSLLPAATVLIGHERMREGLRVDPVIDGCPPFWDPVPDWGAGGSAACPTSRSAPRLTVHLGDRRVDLLHPGGPAHTIGRPGGLAARPSGVLFAGDLVFAGLTPLVFMGSVTGALAALDWLAAFGAATSSSPAMGRCSSARRSSRVLDEHRRYYRFVLALGRDGLAGGRTPLASGSGRRPGRVRRTGQTPSGSSSTCTAPTPTHAGRELDLTAAFADAVELARRPDAHVGLKRTRS